MEETVEALLAEGTTSLLADAGRADVVPFDEAIDDDRAQRAWELELSRYREEAEVRCEARFDPRDEVKSDTVDLNWDGRAEEIDAVLCRVAGELARRDLLLGETAEASWNADGWRRLGYGSAAQYARERLGMSLLIPRGRRRRRCGTTETADAWVARARERTVKHLREEVDAAEMLGRLGIEPERRPPEEATMEELARIERRVVTGAVFVERDGATGATGAEPGAEPGQMFVVPEHGSRGTSPVCSRRDLTPHHVVFRSAGGDDRDENVTSLCTWCHLDGVHGGRLAVTAPADAMTWHIGRARLTVVEGRRRLTH